MAALFDELYAPDFIYHSHAVPGVRIIEDFKRFVPAFHHAFPDIHTTIQDVIAEGDRVVLRYTFRGADAPPGDGQAGNGNRNVHRSRSFRQGSRGLGRGG